MNLLRQEAPEQEMLSFNTGIQLRTPSVVQLHATIRLDMLKKEIDKSSPLRERSALAAAAKTYRTLKAVSSRGALDWLKGMSRPERRRLSEEISKRAGQTKAEKRLSIQAGLLPKTVASDNIQKLVRQELLNAVAAAMAMSGSAAAGVIRSPRVQATAAGKYVFSLVSGF